MDFDDVLTLMGDFGRYQKLIYFVVSVASLLSGIHMLANVFTMAIPQSRCYIEGCDTSTSIFNELWSNFSTNDHCTAFINNSSQHNTSCFADMFLNSTSACYNWIYDQTDYDLTTVSEWHMTCDDNWKVSTSQAVFMCGNLVGSLIFGTIGDKYGRRLVFLIAPIIWASSAFATAFSNSWLVYTALKFLTAACLNGVSATTFVVAIEFIGITKRAWCGNMIQVTFAIGELVLAATAYNIRDWRHLQLAISVPVFFVLLLPCLIPESIRWQLSNGNYNEARETIIKAAKRNKKIISDETIDKLIECSSCKTKGKSANFLQVLKSPILLRRSCNIFFNWMVNALVYYGLSMSASTLGGSPYINFVALAIVEIPAVIIATFVQQRKGRRIVLCVTMVAGGVSCIIAAFLPNNLNWLATTLAVFGKSNIAASFAVIYIYSAEIFPTTLRTSGIGISSMCARLGGAGAPIVADLGHYNKMLPMIIFGGSSVAAGLLSLALPETHNKKLPQTVSEAENFGKVYIDVNESDENENMSLRAPLL